MREDGYYWVVYRGRWIVAEWGAGCWMSVEFGARNEYLVSDQELDKIAERVIREPFNELEKSQLFLFLEAQSDAQGNAGCNDWELPNTEEGRELLKNSTFSSFSNPKEAEEYLSTTKAIRGKLLTMDSMVLEYLVSKLKRLL